MLLGLVPVFQSCWGQGRGPTGEPHCQQPPGLILSPHPTQMVGKGSGRMLRVRCPRWQKMGARPRGELVASWGG